MKKLYIGICLLFIINMGWSESPVIELITEPVAEFPFRGTTLSSWYFDGEVYLSRRDVTYRLSLEIGEIYKFDGLNNELMSILGFHEERFIVDKYPGYSVERPKKIFFWDPRKDEYEYLAGIDGGQTQYGPEIRNLFHFYDNYYIGTEEKPDDVDSGYSGAQYFYNVSTGEKISGIPNMIRDLSPDKLTGLFERKKFGHIEGYEIRSIQNQQVVYGFIPQEYITEVFYYSNDLIGVKYNNDIYVYDLNGELSLTFKITRPEGYENIGINYVKVKNSNYGYFYFLDKPEILLVNTPKMIDYLQENGYLFTPTTGRCIDTRVRVREWPLLEAQHLAFLEEGDELEILDRSGIKVEIGDMEDYWYKIRRVSDGLEGWSYGAFIELDEVE